MYNLGKNENESNVLYNLGKNENESNVLYNLGKNENESNVLYNLGKNENESKKRLSYLSTLFFTKMLAKNKDIFLWPNFALF